MEKLKELVLANLKACESLHYARARVDGDKTRDYREHLSNCIDYNEASLNTVRTHLALMAEAGEGPEEAEEEPEEVKNAD